MNIKKGSLSIIIICFCILLTGCSKGSDHSRWALFKKVDPQPLSIYAEDGDSSLVEGIKKDTASVSAIYDVAVIKGKKDTLVAYKVKHMSRFKMKSIEKELTKKLKSDYPDEKFTVSSDFKIFLETMRLWDKMQDPNYSDKKANKRLKAIIKLNNELT